MTKEQELFKLVKARIGKGCTFDERNAEEWLEWIEENKENFHTLWKDEANEYREVLFQSTWDVHTGVYKTKLYKALQ